MRLIDADHLLSEIADLKKSPWYNADYNHEKYIREEAIEVVEDLCIKQEPTVQAVPIPDNVTNGDVIKAMFPNGITSKFVSFMRLVTGDTYVDCSYEWWNAPYEPQESEEV